MAGILKFAEFTEYVFFIFFPFYLSLYSLRSISVNVSWYRHRYRAFVRIRFFIE
jgi:hypothetical protein